MKSTEIAAACTLCVALSLLIGCRPSGPDTQRETQVPLPDWSGLWEVVGLTVGASGTFEESPEELRKSFGETPPPYTADWPTTLSTDPEFNKYITAVDGILTCSFGFPWVMLESPLMFEALVTPHETAMIFSGRESRHIYTDGRPHTPTDELWPTFWGDSIGHWEGQTLVVDTIALNQEMVPNNWLVIGVFGSDFYEPVAVLSEQARFTERIRMVSKDLLEDQMTIEDPRALSGPWQLTHQYQRVTGVTRMVHEDCRGNDRNPVVNGKFTLTRP